MSDPIQNLIGNAARTAYDLMFQASPIIFAGGSFSSTLGGLMPVIQIVSGVLSDVVGNSDLLPQVRFVPMPGATAISNQAATYSFANRNVAANAIIRNPKRVSLLMIAPVNSIGGYLMKLAIFTALQAAFDNHNANGGTYHIMTPSFPYTDCIMTGMTDVTSGEGKQQQTMWQIDFEQPLITQAAAAQAYSGMMSMISGGQQVTSSSWSEMAAIAGTAVQGVVSSFTGIFQTL